MKKMDKKAFTLIELLVVIAVVGILVLLGAPRFIGYTQKSELARIQHDVKVMEQEVGTMLINNDDDINNWESNSKDFNKLTQENKFFKKEGAINNIEDLSTDKTYKIIPEKYKDNINTKLKGTFYTNSGGKVYYEHVKPIKPGEKEPEYSNEGVEGLIKEGYIPIATAEDLNSIKSISSRTYGEGTEWKDTYAGGLDKKYVQVANIDLSGYLEEDWTPIGNSDSRFTGSFNGNGYNITGLTINRSTSDHVGLFGYTEKATIRNVALEDINVIGLYYVGGLVGVADSSTIENSYATGSVKGSYSVGGLVGWTNTSTTIRNSYSTGSVTGSIGNIGGLVGYSYSSTIENSYTTGEVTGSNIAGGLVGYANSGSEIINSYWNIETTGQEESDAGEGKITEEMKKKDTYSGWDFDTVWKIDEGDYPKLR